MQWKITTKPSNDELSEWQFIAERADGETTVSGMGIKSYGIAVQTAHDAVNVAESAFQIVEDNTTVEDYTPSAQVIAAILAAR